MAKGRQRGHAKGNHIGRQTAIMAGAQRNHLGPVAPVMDQQNRVFSAGLFKGFRDCPETLEQEIPPGCIIGDRPARAACRTAPAAGADQRIDRDGFAIGRYRPGRAGVETSGTAIHAGPRMGAERLVEPDMEGFFEIPDQLGRVKGGTGHRPGIAGIRPEISVAPVRRGEQRRPLAQVEDDVAFGPGAITRRPEGKVAAPGRIDAPQGVDMDPEMSQRALGPAQLPDDQLVFARKRRRVDLLDQHGHRQHLRQLFGNRQGGGGVAQHQAGAVGMNVHHPDRGRLEQGVGNQGCHFRPRCQPLARQPVRSLGRPAGPVAQIDKAERMEFVIVGGVRVCGLGRDFGGDIGEKGLLLPTRDDCITLGYFALGTGHVLAAQGVKDARTFQPGCRLDRPAVDLLRTETIT